MPTALELHDEIEADPAGLGYKEVGGEWKGDSVVADLLNLANLKVDRAEVPMEDVRASVHFDAYNDLVADRQEFLRYLTPNGGHLRITADIKLQLTGRAAAAGGVAGTGTDAESWWSVAERAAVVALLLPMVEVDGSRADVLWGHGTRIRAGDVGAAANA